MLPKREQISVQAGYASTCLFFISGLFVPAGLLILTSYLGCAHVVAAVALVTTAIGLLGLNFSGYAINHLDIAPSYAGILQGITNTFATVPGFLGPTVVGILTENRVRIVDQIIWQRFTISARQILIVRFQ